MFAIKKWLLGLLHKLRRDKAAPLENVDAKLARDLGVSVTRIRLPSGKDVVIVKPVIESSSDRNGDSSIADQ